MNSHRLHPVQVVDDREAVEPEAAVREMVHVFDAERVGPAMRDVETRPTLLRHVLIAPEYRPDSTHGPALFSLPQRTMNKDDSQVRVQNWCRHWHPRTFKSAHWSTREARTEFRQFLCQNRVLITGNTVQLFDNEKSP